MAVDYDAIIEDLAAGPAEVEGDAGRVKARSIKELIEAEQRAAQKAASALPNRGMRITKLAPPGAA